MRKTKLTFVNRYKSVEDELTDFVINNFSEKPEIILDENRIVSISFLGIEIRDNYTESVVEGLSDLTTMHELNLINEIAQKMSRYNSYLDEIADFYVNQNQ